MERIIKLNDTFNKIYQSAAVALLAGIFLIFHPLQRLDQLELFISSF